MWNISPYSDKFPLPHIFHPSYFLNQNLDGLLNNETDLHVLHYEPQSNQSTILLLCVKWKESHTLSNLEMPVSVQTYYRHGNL